MTDLQKINAVTEIIETYGAERQTIIAMEECSELIQALSKVLREGISKETKEHLTEEIADVLIMINQMKVAYGIKNTDIHKVIEDKLYRQLGRIKSEEQ